jgi:flavin reductase (DIM6/NTAB) family NADH-FMN oxidoreductase RutF
MAKILQNKLETTILPVTPILTTVAGPRGEPDDITVAWTGVACSNPPLIALGLRIGLAAYDLLRQTGEFVCNVPTQDMLEAFDRIDLASAQKGDKFAMFGLTRAIAHTVKPPLILEAPVNVECRVEQVLEFGGSHDLFIGRVVAVHFEETVVNEKGELVVEAIHPFVMCAGSGEFWNLGKEIGHLGFTAQKKRLY